jgi:hypothetical protein
VSEWWTYRPSDFLMFSPRIYWRLFASMNEAWWPLPVLAPALALALGLWAWRQGSTAALRAALAASAAACALVAWAFLWQRFAPIQWVAEGYAWGFGVLAVGLLMAAARSAIEAVPQGPRRQAAAVLGLWALLLQPLLAGLAGRPWMQAELWGLAPDPTAIGTLAVALLVQPRRPTARWLLRLLWAGPLLWCAISAATLATMGEAQALVPLVAMLAAGAAAQLSRARSPPAAGR